MEEEQYYFQLPEGRCRRELTLVIVPFKVNASISVGVIIGEDLGVKNSFQDLLLSCTMLLRPNKAETAVHGCWHLSYI